jgi:hypothetical protein
MVSICLKADIISNIPGKDNTVSKRPPDIPKANMTVQERGFRSQLAQLVSGRGLIRGTLSVRERTCGKAVCKCVRGEKHVGLYLVVSHGGKLRQLFIPQAYEEKVRQWIEEYRRAEKLLEEIADIHWVKLQNRKE